MKVILKYKDGLVVVIDAMAIWMRDNDVDVETVNGSVWSFTASNIAENKNKALVSSEPIVFVDVEPVQRELGWW